MRLIFLFALFAVANCSAQQPDNIILSNQIFHAPDGKLGVKNAKGDIIIPALYTRMYPYDNLQNPSFSNQQRKPSVFPLPYYIVGANDSMQGVFDQYGKKVFDFIRCYNLQIDPKTNSVVVIQKYKDNREKSQLYSMNGQCRDTTLYKQIGFMAESDFVILERQKREVYLFHSKTGKKLGPYEHFNYWDEYFNYRMNPGKKDPHIKGPIGFTVRLKDVWGLLDTEGNEILPMNYESLWLFTDEERKQPMYINTEKPQGVDIIAYGTTLDHQRVFFDTKFKTYLLDESEPGKRRFVLK
jgi:hypothetical protein